MFVDDINIFKRGQVLMNTTNFSRSNISTTLKMLGYKLKVEQPYIKA